MEESGIPPRRAPAGRLISVTVLILALLTASAATLEAQVRPVYSQGAAGVLQQIQKLLTTASVLEVGAHPDDEDSLFIARSALGDHARVGYLSLTRGEGGQNAIGPEQFEALGIIRTEELLQARTLDGGDQYFGREYDFGFSKTLEETARMWGRRETLVDIVRTIRAYRPLVVYSIFSGTPADGHGHHQLSGSLSPEAVRAAADPAEFPEQIAEGLRPWRAPKLYLGSGFGPFRLPVTVTLNVEAGRLDPLVGRSYVEIAAEGRSQHKTQRQGTAEAQGSLRTGLARVDPPVPARAPGETSAFEGIDTSIPGIAALAGLPAGSLKAELAAIEKAARKAVDQYRPLEPEASVPLLAEALSAIRAARRSLSGLSFAAAGPRAEADFLLAIKEREAAAALQKASGTVVDAVSDTETVCAGESFGAAVRVFLSRPSLVKITGVTLLAPEGWRIETAPPSQGTLIGGVMPETADRTDGFRISVPQGAELTQPYWLRSPRAGQLYQWPAGSPRGDPFDAPLLRAEVRGEIGGAALVLTQPVQFRIIDPVRGELRRNVEVVPALTLSLGAGTEVVPFAKRGEPRRISVRVQSNAQGPVAGAVRLDAPPGWDVSPSASSFSLQRPGDRSLAVFTVTPPAGAPAGTYTLKAAATAGGSSYTLTGRAIAYPHIQTHRLYAPAVMQVLVLDLAVAPVSVGYIMGSGDRVPDALRQMGLPVTLLDEDALASGDLSRFDTIVVGINASSARPDFAGSVGRLDEYMQNGGTLIVQYQQRDYAARNLLPFPAQMPSRVTDENAEVRILQPDHPAFTTPNRIDQEDFAGWVQDRNLNALASFDPRYTALLESHDPGEGPQEGGEVWARIGKGQYVYTAYAWFRQLPAGVPGAYRLFANLVSLGKTR
jgi:LmbE family N-acetylglucosaminyl deacetylase